MTPAALTNRLAILDDWTAKGAAFRLCPDTSVLQWRGTDRLPEWAREHLEVYKADFAEALRFGAGLCIRCGLDAAVRPNSAGRRQLFDPATGVAVLVPTKRHTKAFGPFEAVWAAVAAPEDSFPLLWCDACFGGGAWGQWCWGVTRKAGPVAEGTHKRDTSSDDDLFDGIEESAEPLFSDAALF